MKAEEKKTKKAKKPKKRHRKLILLFIGVTLIVVAYVLFLFAAFPGDMKEQVRAAIKSCFDGKVFISRVRFSPIRGIIVRDLHLTGQNGEPFVYIRKLTLKLDLAALLRRDLVITQVTVETPQIMLTCSPEEGWNAQRLFKSSGGLDLSKKRAAISSLKIVDGSVSLRDDSLARPRFPFFLFRSIHVSTVQEDGSPSRLRVDGSIVDNILGENWKLNGLLDTEKSAVELSLSKKGIQLDDRVRRKIPPLNLGRPWEVAALDGVANLDFKLSYVCGTRSQLNYNLHLNVEKCRARIDGFPYTIDSLQGDIEFKDGQMALKDIRAASSTISGTVAGVVFPGRQRDIRLAAKDVCIDKTLIGQFGANWQTTMERLELRGMADATCRITESVSGAKPFDYSLKMDLKNCSAAGPDMPMAVKNINGVLTWNGQDLSCRGLHGESDAGAFRVRDTTLNMNLKMRRRIDVEMKDVAIERLLAELGSRNPDRQKQMAAYKPSGRADVVCRISWDENGENMDYEITADFRDLRMTYPGVDKPLQDFAGKLKLDSQDLYVETASGACGRNTISIQHLRTRRDSGDVVSGQIKLEGWLVDKDLKAFVPKGPRSIIKDLNLEGHVNVAHKIDPDPKKTETTITLLDCSAQYVKTPYPIHNITGSITYKEDKLIFENVKGKNGPAAVQLKTKVLDLEKRGPVQIELLAKDLPLDSQLKSVLPESIIPYWDQFNPAGNVDLDLAVAFTIGAPEDLSVRTAVHWNRSRLKYVDFPYSVSDVTGVLEIRRDRIILKDIAGKAGTGQLRFHDTVIFRGEQYGMDLKIEGTDMSLDKQLRECLRKDVQTAWDIVNPAGRFNFTWQQTKGHGKDAAMDYSLRLELADAEMTCAYFKYPLKQMKGVIRFANNKATFSNVIGRNGKATVVLSGYATGTPGRGEDLVSLEVEARDVPLDDDVKNALPETYHQVWDDLMPKDTDAKQGTVSVSARVRYREHEPGKVVINYELSPLTFENCSLDLGDVPMTNIKGAIRLQGEVFPGRKPEWTNEKADAPKPGSAVSGSVKLSEVTVANKKYTELDIPRFVGMFYGAKDFEFHIPWIQAYLYGGRLTGEMSIDRASKRYADKEVRYTAEFKVSNVNAKDLVELSGIDIRGIKGILEAESSVKGTGLNPEQLEASGTMTIRDGDMGDLPQRFGIPRKVLRRTRFSRAHMKYRIKKARAYIDELDFEGEKVKFIGRGKFNIDPKSKEELPAELVFRFKGKGPLQELLKSILEPEYTVKLGPGTHEPIWKVDPLVPLRNLVRGLATVLQIDKDKKKDVWDDE